MMHPSIQHLSIARFHPSHWPVFISLPSPLNASGSTVTFHHEIRRLDAPHDAGAKSGGRQNLRRVLVRLNGPGFAGHQDSVLDFSCLIPIFLASGTSPFPMKSRRADAVYTSSRSLLIVLHSILGSRPPRCFVSTVVFSCRMLEYFLGNNQLSAADSPSKQRKSDLDLCRVQIVRRFFSARALLKNKYVPDKTKLFDSHHRLFHLRDLSRRSDVVPLVRALMSVESNVY